jgi:rhamnulokinase
MTVDRGDARSGSTAVLTAAAVDLGATSGRVLVGRVGARELSVDEVARFANEPVRDEAGVLRWDLDALWRAIGAGVRTAVVDHGATSVAVDSWAVDYGLVRHGRLIAAPACYRDGRTDGIAERAARRLDWNEHFAITGIARLPFNTVYQLLAEPAEDLSGSTMLLLPDLLVWRMTGTMAAERTNASTTALYDITSGDWSEEICARLGIPTSVLAPIAEPGSVAGRIEPGVLQEWGLPTGCDVTVVRAASHDTASAVIAVPAERAPSAYVSCGTWSLVGQELPEPVLSERARDAQFTNEIGIDGTVRFLRNLTGLWLLSQSLEAWREQGLHVHRDEVLAEAARLDPDRFLLDPESEALLAPGDMPARIAAQIHSGERPATPAEFVRCIIDSLAHGHARTVHRVAELSGTVPEKVHIVGGGSANALLCKATAVAARLPVEAGPVEATAIGNLVVQGRAAGVLPSGETGRQQARALVRSTQSLVVYGPES